MKSDAGYSLFEVLIAFAVMAFVLAALLPGQVRFIAQANDASDSLLAQDFAYSRLARIGLGGAALLADGQKLCDAQIGASRQQRSPQGRNS